jgi:mono/diheme cytochrome c family protein
MPPAFPNQRVASQPLNWWRSRSWLWSGLHRDRCKTCRCDQLNCDWKTPNFRPGGDPFPRGAGIRRRLALIAGLALLWLASLPFLTGHGWAGDDKADFFEARIRPLLIKHCLECHGDEGPESNLRLTSREHLLTPAESGEAALDLDRPAASQLLAALRYDGELQMPPSGKLSDEEIAAFEKWVEDGAVWPASAAPVRASGLVISEADRAHWSFRPAESPVVPTVAQAEWVRTPVDAFILAKLEQAGLEPSPVADRRTLLRRLTYDLTGLPPTGEELAAFLADESPTAYEQVVTRLLASPRYGERWGRHWLDVARYADTKDGVLMFGADRMRPFAYTYRDYVIRALNEDTPYDQFIREQLAADLIQPAVEPWRLGALGFLTLGRMFDNNVHDIIDDQIDTTTRGFLGLTVSCARCHDHKFDPVPIADYYSLHGVFANCEVPMELPLIEDPTASDAGRKFEDEIAAKRQELRDFVGQQHALQTEDARQRVGAYLAHALSTPPDPMETAVFFRSLTPDDFRPQITVRWRKLLAQRLRLDDPVFGPAADFLQQLAAGATDPESEGGGPSAESTTERWQQVLAAWAKRPSGTATGQVNPLLLEQLRSSPVTTPAELGQAYGAALLAIYRQTMAAAGTNGTTETRGTGLISAAAVDSPAPPGFPRAKRIATPAAVKLTLIMGRSSSSIGSPRRIRPRLPGRWPCATPNSRTRRGSSCAEMQPTSVPRFRDSSSPSWRLTARLLARVVADSISRQRSPHRVIR